MINSIFVKNKRGSFQWTAEGTLLVPVISLLLALKVINSDIMDNTLYRK